MNILIITDLYPKSKDHSVKYITWAVHELVRGLYKYDINVKKVIRPVREVHWKGLKKSKQIFQQETIDNILVETRSFINLPKRSFYLRKNDISYLDDSLKDVDLVITHMSFGANLANLIYKKYNINFIYILHETDFRTLNRQEDIFKNSVSIYTRSWALNSQLKEYGIVSDGVVYSGIDEKLINFDCRSIGSNQQIKFISVNRLEARKNIDITLKVLSKLPKEYDWEYVIIGEGSQRTNLSKLIKELNISNRVKLLGFQERSFCLEKMRESDVFIMPSNPETFGLAYLEAMASNCIVICAKNCGVDGLIENNINGYTVESRNEKQLEELLIKLFKESQINLLYNSQRLIQKNTLDLAQKNYASIINYALLKKNKNE
jgi:glycosyltransferase involved in cell wall biosynthesis